MFQNLGGWTFIIILVIILLLFGAPKLPQLAKSVGESMRIFRGEMKTMKNEKAADSEDVKTDEAKNADSGNDDKSDPTKN